MNKNLFEKIMNYLLQYDFQNIKLIYIEKEKYINTIIMNKVKTNIVEEKGFSISFYHKDQPFFIALNNLDKFSIAKKRINETVKNKKRVTVKEPFVIKEINVKEKNFDRFDVDKYRNDLSRFTLENKDLLDISIPL